MIRMELTEEGLEAMARFTGKTIEMDPETGRARLVHESVTYTSVPADGAA